MRRIMKLSVKGKVMTYAVCSGDDDRTGDERQAVVHADLECGLPAMTTEEPETLSVECTEQGAESWAHGSPAGSALNHPWDCSLFSWGPELSPS